MKKHIMRTGIIALAVILLLALMAAAAPRASQEAVVDGVTYEFEILEGNNVSITDINVPDLVTAVNIPGTITSGEETYTVTDYDFWNYDDFDSVLTLTLPNTLTAVSGEFRSFPNVTEITIPGSVEVFENGILQHGQSREDCFL